MGVSRSTASSSPASHEQHRCDHEGKSSHGDFLTITEHELDSGASAYRHLSGDINIKRFCYTYDT